MVFLFYFAKAGNLIWLIEAFNKINWVSQFDNSLSFDDKQNALLQIFFKLGFFKDFFTKNSN